MQTSSTLPHSICFENKRSVVATSIAGGAERLKSLLQVIFVLGGV